MLMLLEKGVILWFVGRGWFASVVAGIVLSEQSTTLQNRGRTPTWSQARDFSLSRRTAKMGDLTVGC
jgi:hypothetical protein